MNIFGEVALWPLFIVGLAGALAYWLRPLIPLMKKTEERDPGTTAERPARSAGVLGNEDD